MLLALETSSRSGSVALIEDGEVRVQVALDARDHAASLAPRVTELVAGRWDQIGAYALGVGPGSFTGLRIGLAFLKGLAMVHPRPTVGVSSLEALEAEARLQHPGAQILVLLDARKGEVFGRSEGLLEDGLYAGQQLAARFGATPLVVVGDGAALDFGSVAWQPKDAPKVPSAGSVGLLAWPRWRAGEGVDADRIGLLYHQAAAAEVKRAQVNA